MSWRNEANMSLRLLGRVVQLEIATIRVSEWKIVREMGKTEKGKVAGRGFETRNRCHGVS